MSDQDGAPPIPIRMPVPTKDMRAMRAYWITHWKRHGQPWRREREIRTERQKYLAALRNSKENSPFKNVKLHRADVEWLLATHENGLGPIDWSDESQRGREGVYLSDADLRGVDLEGLPLGGIDLFEAHLEGANLNEVHLEGAALLKAHLEGASLNETHLEGANLFSTHLEGAFLFQAHLEGAKLNNTFFSDVTNLNEVTLTNQEFGEISLLDVHWGDVNVAVIDWSSISILGDERKAGQLPEITVPSYEENLIWSYQRAARAYRQLSVVLKNQGLNEDSNRFVYRAQLMQRKVFRLQKKSLRYLGSLFLDLLTGYGYKPLRSFLAYLIVILTFATAYFILGRTVGPALSPLGSVVFSMTSFHGRGFFPGGITLDDPLTVLAALEAFVGLLIEVTFIATLTRRLFGG